MPLTFCFKVTRNIAKYGYAKMAARRLANACIILMALACGLMGIDVNEKEPLCPIAGAGVVFTGAPAGNVSPVFSAIRR
jgi:hypothetical protein